MSQKSETLWAFLCAAGLSFFSILFFPISELTTFGLLLTFSLRLLGIIIFGYLISYIVEFIVKFFKSPIKENIRLFITVTSMLIVTFIYIILREYEKYYE